MKEWLKNLGLVVLATLFALAVAEVSARTFYEPRTKEIKAFQLAGSSFYQRDDELGWVPKKNVQGQHDKPGSFESSFSTNAYGLRDRNHSLSKTDGMTRIVVLGDSFTWGFGVNDGEVFTDHLEATLDGAEVINLGVSGYILQREISYFRRLGIRFEPDVLILALALNDIYGARDYAKTAALRQKNANGSKKDSKASLLPTVKRSLSRNSALYAMFQDTTSQYRTLVDILVWVGLKDPPLEFADLDSNLMPALREYPEILREAWENHRAQLLELKGICEERGIRYIIALVPSRQTIDERSFQQSIAYTVFYDDDFDLDKPYRELEAFGRTHQIEIINPVGAFQDAADSGLGLYLPRDMHFNKHGHKIFSEQIRNYLSNTPG